MIGDMIAKVRKEKGMTKTELARLTQINIGHLTHIEKGERNPSHKALKNICKALDVPYQQLMYTYDKQISEEQESYGFIKHISYNKVLAVNTLENFIDCPSSTPSASLAIKINDSSMEPLLKKNSYAFIEFNSPLNSKDIGLFSVDNKILIRRLIINKNKIVLKSFNEDIKDIDVTNSNNFYIIGKILNVK
ncbi:MAG: XRE family transcriptional regulator [Clostridia bacterium]|nr:XRE family transcriptional regulator [Clostridia bacterium]